MWGQGCTNPHTARRADRIVTETRKAKGTERRVVTNAQRSSHRVVTESSQESSLPTELAHTNGRGEEAPRPGALRHGDWRDFREDQQDASPQRGFVDGDVVESILELPRPASHATWEVER